MYCCSKSTRPCICRWHDWQSAAERYRLLVSDRVREHETERAHEPRVKPRSRGLGAVAGLYEVNAVGGHLDAPRAAATLVGVGCEKGDDVLVTHRFAPHANGCW